MGRVLAVRDEALPPVPGLFLKGGPGMDKDDATRWRKGYAVLRILLQLIVAVAGAFMAYGVYELVRIIKPLG